ncbi:hypothetical protein Zmor_011588 [Zophobas morio]|uniref:Uncharacterized protein n=1 Tax=Zophobas morio TaxID=2755281 RepID=A0AA38IRE6_9CUCU|nr:hypothetical protein Zmor_011588 [Zophobas morio]
MVSRDESKVKETQNITTRKTPRFVVAPRSCSPGEHSSQIPGRYSWSPPPVVPRITVLADLPENDSLVPDNFNGNTLSDDTLPSKLRLFISASLDSLSKDHKHLVEVAKEALTGTDESFQVALNTFIATLTPDNSASNKRPTPSRAPPVYRNRAQAKAAAYTRKLKIFIRRHQWRVVKFSSEEAQI